MARVCFAQNFEDVVLWRALRHVRLGRYLDIGAQDPVIDSVSQSFYRDGWRGISVEPNPRYAAALREDRPDEEIVEAAVGNGTGPLEFFVVHDTGLSTGDPQLAAVQRAQGRTVSKITVPTIPLETLLDRFADGELHWLKIDVEGMEAAVLESWGNSPVRPWIVVVESIDPITAMDNAQTWCGLIEQRGYHEALFDGVNRFFVANEHSELDPALAVQANCLDNYTVPAHHWSTANAVQLYQGLLGEAEGRAADRDRLFSELEHAREALAERERSLQVFAETVVALREANARQAQQLAQADRLLALADALAAPWGKRLLGLLRPATRARVRRLRFKLAEWSAHFSAAGIAAVPIQAREGIAMDMYSFDDRDPYHRAVSLAELCRFADVNFVRCAFVTMLGRQPDPDGEAHYLGRLRRGDAKLAILLDLQNSAEGRQHDPGIAGLRRELRRAEFARRPLAGWIVRLLTGREGDGTMERQLRVLRNMAELDRELSARRAAVLALGQEDLAEGLRQVQSAVRSGAAAGATPGRVAQAEGGGEETWEQVLGTIINA